MLLPCVQYYYPDIDLDDAAREKIVGFLTFFSLSEHKPNELTVADFEALKKKAIELDKKYEKRGLYKLRELIVERDKGFLEKQTKCAALVLKATGLIAQRLDELDQIGGKITASSTTDKGIEKLMSNLEELEKAGSALTTEIKQIFQTVVVSPLDTDSSVTKLWDIHRRIYSEKKQAVKQRNSVCIGLNLSDAFLDTPLLADRIIAKIEATQQLIKSLTSIRERLSANLVALTAVINSRSTLAHDAQYRIEDDARQALIKIQTMKKVTAYRTRFNEVMDTAAGNIGLLLNNMSNIQAERPGNIASSPSPLTEGQITERLRVATQEIDTLMKPVLKKVEEENAAYLLMVQHTKDRLESLRNGVTQRLPHQGDQFTHLSEIANALLALGQFRTNEIVHLDYGKLTAIQDEIVTGEALADTLMEEITTRENSGSVHVIKEMIVSICAEIDAIKGINKDDSRLPILTELHSGLGKTLDNYVQLRIGDFDFITESIDTMQKGLSRDKLERLSDEAINPLVSFIRKLLEPLVQLIKGYTGESYRPNFFAKPIETNLAKAAQTADTALKVIKKDLQSIEVPVSGPTRSAG